ncbi:hypothetical protein [Pseudomonas guariconensis]|uniref:hypothetical protein n=1 Tax=Pseudomonas guariconensis TaxID=1288410 RepID=UPI0025A9D801|nr:hypothetical protein [Pseudomonas guariconensis]MDM9607525.1 hypothetical protein [Pseudomonas guariconensis]
MPQNNDAHGWIACDDGLHLIQMDKNLSHYGWVFRKVDGGLPYSVREATSYEMAHAQARQHLRIGVAQIAGQAPAPQPHPEPIAWMVGTAFWWPKEEAERDSVAMGLPIVGLGPMTDTSEIERLVAANTEYARRHLELQGEVERLSRKAANADLALAAQTRQVTTLRAQLAERDALLREVLVGLWPSTPLAIKINAALSASAEPSAPVEIDERPEGCCCPPKGYNGLWAAGPCPVHQGLRKLEQARTALARKPS